MEQKDAKVAEAGLEKNEKYGVRGLRVKDEGGEEQKVAEGEGEQEGAEGAEGAEGRG